MGIASFRTQCLITSHFKWLVALFIILQSYTHCNGVYYLYDVCMSEKKSEKDLKMRKKNHGADYFKKWPSYQKRLTGGPEGRPKKDE